MDASNLLKNAQALGAAFGIKIVAAIAIFIIGRWVARKTRVREDLLLIYFPVDDRIYAFFFLGPRSSRCAQSRLATSHGLNLVFKV